MASISLKGISKAWGSVVGVDAIDLEIKDKEFIVFLGPSGCGKTTTMRRVAGLENPTGGNILIDGEDVTDVDARDRVAIMDKGKIQQLGTPHDVYNDPANVFVAGFIGSPPINLLAGPLEKGTFIGTDTKVPKVGKGSRAKVTLGIRPEDVNVVASGKGYLNSKVYSVEPTGDQTLLAVDVAGKLFVARAGRNYRKAIDAPVSLNFDVTRAYLFDGETGQRIRG